MGASGASGHILPAEGLFPVLEGHGLLGGGVGAGAGEYDTTGDPHPGSLGDRFPERLVAPEPTGRVSWGI